MDKFFLKKQYKININTILKNKINKIKKKKQSKPTHLGYYIFFSQIRRTTGLTLILFFKRDANNIISSISLASFLG